MVTTVRDNVTVIALKEARIGTVFCLYWEHINITSSTVRLTDFSCVLCGCYVSMINYVLCIANRNVMSMNYLVNSVVRSLTLTD